MPSYRRLQQYAIAISIISVIYNGVEGGLSIGFGAESNSKSLIFFGIQSGIEVISSLLVVWRFRKIAKPGEERAASLSSRDLRFEKYGTFGIGLLLIALALGTLGSAIATLVMHKEPNASNASLIISASALVIMVLIWLPKRYLATALNSSTMRGEATCSLSCVQLTCVLFGGSLLFRVWRGGWWVDGATAIVLSVLFAWEGHKMVSWARDPEFTGGCCEDCRTAPATGPASGVGDVELGVSKDLKEKSGCCYISEGSTEVVICELKYLGCRASCCSVDTFQTVQKEEEATPAPASNQVVSGPAVAETPPQPSPESAPTKKGCCAGCCDDD